MLLARQHIRQFPSSFIPNVNDKKCRKNSHDAHDTIVSVMRAAFPTAHRVVIVDPPVSVRPDANERLIDRIPPSMTSWQLISNVGAISKPPVYA
jgi:hypothetical protein